DRRVVAAARNRARARVGAIAHRLGQPVPRVAAEQIGAAAFAAVLPAAQAVQQGVGARRACVAAVPLGAIHRVRLHDARLLDHPHAVNRPAADAGRRRDRAGRFVRAGTGVHLAGGDGHRHLVRHARCPARDADRLPRRAGAADGAVLRVADLDVDLAGHHRRDAGTPRAGDLPEPGVCRRRVHDRLAGRERARAGRQPGHAPGADDGARGADPRILGPPPRADRMGREPEAVRLLVRWFGAVLPVGHRRGACAAGDAAGAAGAGAQAGNRRRRARHAGDPQRQDAHLPRARVPGHRVPVGGDRSSGAHPARQLGRNAMNPLLGQFINLLGAVLLMLAFAMISQRRVLSLVHLFTLQGAVLVVATAVVGYATAQPHLFISAALTLVLKVLLIPNLLHRVIDRLEVRWDTEPLLNIPTTMLIGILLVIFAFNLGLPIARFSSTIARGTLGIALACVLLSF